MNTNLLNIVKQIITGYGEAVLADPQRLKAFFSDFAKEEPKPLRIAFGRCIEAKAYEALKTAPDAAERAERKAIIAQRMRDEHGLDTALCGEALDILDAALYGTSKITLGQQHSSVSVKQIEISPLYTSPTQSIYQQPHQVTAQAVNSTPPMLEEDTVKRSQEIWVCGRCNTSNKFDRDFCKKCGKEFNPPLVTSQKEKKIKIRPALWEM
jgi:ribosomal protein L40E